MELPPNALKMIQPSPGEELPLLGGFWGSSGVIGVSLGLAGLELDPGCRDGSGLAGGCCFGSVGGFCPGLGAGGCPGAVVGRASGSAAGVCPGSAAAGICPGSAAGVCPGSAAGVGLAFAGDASEGLNNGSCVAFGVAGDHTLPGCKVVGGSATEVGETTPAGTGGGVV